MGTDGESGRGTQWVNPRKGEQLKGYPVGDTLGWAWKSASWLDFWLIDPGNVTSPPRASVFYKVAQLVKMLSKIPWILKSLKTCKLFLSKNLTTAILRLPTRSYM